MSRIHEALKRAELEKKSAAVVPPIREGVLQPIAARDDSTSESFFAPGLTRADSLTFEKLWTSCSVQHWSPDLALSVFASPTPPLLVAEEFRTLRARLYQMREKIPLKSVLVTSAVPMEGKTFIAGNLAQSLVRQRDQRVLLIDADLRRPKLNALIGAPNAPGLAEYLRGEVDEFAAVQRGQDDYLCFVASGVPTSGASELLLNGRLKAFLERIAPLFDWIIIDSPPCLPVTDASLLGEFADGILMVIRAATTPSAAAQKACQNLQGRNIIGVVLNRADDSANHKIYYDRYGYEPTAEARTAHVDEMIPGHRK